MNRKFTILLLCLLANISAFAWDLSDLKNVLGGGSGSGAADAVSGIINGLLKTEKLTISDLQGSWAYSSPAVTFKSDNLLQKAGGEAAASAIEKKLESYYKTTGLNTLNLTVNTDSTFVFKVKKILLKGTIESVNENTDGANHNFIFHFQALGKINLGSINAYITKTPSGQVDIMFDVTKLIAIAEKVSTITKSQSITTAVSLLKSYDGICAGFTLDKTSAN